MSDIEAARAELVERGVEVSEPFHDAAVYSIMPARKAASAARIRPAKLRLVRLVQRSGRQRLGVPGGHRAIAGTGGRERPDIPLVG